ATIQPSWPDLIDLIRASTETGTVAPLSVDGPGQAHGCPVEQVRLFVARPTQPGIPVAGLVPATGIKGCVFLCRTAVWLRRNLEPDSRGSSPAMTTRRILYLSLSA